jgi:cytochrome P450/NADPH-cytochrome P450 reductase
MRESMRLSPTAPARAVVPLEDPCILIGGDGDSSNPSNKRYHVPPGNPLVVQSGMMMRDVRVWGEDAEQFKPERMLDGGFEKLPVSCLHVPSTN